MVYISIFVHIAADLHFAGRCRGCRSPTLSSQRVLLLKAATVAAQTNVRFCTAAKTGLNSESETLICFILFFLPRVKHVS